jgi:choline dehydrogenase-like flavoprotein
VTDHFDVIIVGTGAGGGTLAPSGQRILLVEWGDFLPRETDSWEPGPVFVDGRYLSPDTWYDADGAIPAAGRPAAQPVHPLQHRRHQLHAEHRRGEPGAHRHGQRDPGRPAPAQPDDLT